MTKWHEIEALKFVATVVPFMLGVGLVLALALGGMAWGVLVVLGLVSFLYLAIILPIGLDELKDRRELDRRWAALDERMVDIHRRWAER